MNVKEALQVLEEAAEEGSDEIKNIFSSEYKYLKRAITKNVPPATWEKIKVLDKSIHNTPWYYIGGVTLIACGVGILLGKSMK
ncbi:MAG: hypothetical protein HQK50_02045 [Oligoflexia bacterium]|nr:hypothetical protein [Oligoflexia bacterium]MBF0364320.1 hypothetical protein [Oligoflexia bacterium]